jgi:hypothetical protein
MGAPTSNHRKNKIITDECSMKLWQRYDEGRIGIPRLLKATGLRYFQYPSKSKTVIALCYLYIYLLKIVFVLRMH